MLEELIAEAQKIRDPVEREKRINELMRQILGSPVQRATASPAVVPPAVEPRPEDVQQLMQDIKLTKKLGTTTNLNAMNDEELESLIGGFSSQITPEIAQQEIAARARIDEQSPVANLADPKALLRKAGQVVGGAGELATSGPIALTGLLAKGGELTGADLNADEILRASSDIRDEIRANVGISEPRGIGESLAGLVPNMLPIPGIKGPSSTIGNIAEVVTPVVIGGGNKRIFANFATAAVAEQGIRELTDQAGDKYKTAFDEAGITGGIVEDKIYPEAAKALATGLGLFAGAAIVTPALVNVWRTQRAKTPRSLVPIRDIDPHGPENLSTLELASDLYKTYLGDEKAVLKDIYKQGGAPDFEEIGKLIDQDTQMTALMRTNEGMRTGQMRTMYGNFIVNTTPNQLLKEYKRLPQPMQIDADMYMKYKNYSELLGERIAKALKSKTPNVANIALDQQNQRLANHSAYTIEQRFPQVTEFAKRYRHITEGVRTFLGSGPSSMLSQQELHRLALERSHFVPSDVLGVDPTEGLMKRLKDVTRPIEQRTMDDWYRQGGPAQLEGVEHQANSFEMLVDYTRNALKSKMENDVRGAIVRGQKNAPLGKATLREATPKEVMDYPNRVVSAWENGENKKYLSSQLQASLMKFDPNVAKFPMFFVPKRLMELGLTGPASIAFAPMTMLRDSLAGFVLATKGTKGPGTWEVPAAIGKQVWAKAQLAIIDVLQDSTQGIPFMPPATRKALAQQMSASYMNSFYHLAQTVGGTDASLTKHSVQAARGVMREVARSLEGVRDIPGAKLLGRPAAVLWDGFAALFDAIQESPRLAAAERMYNTGMDAGEAVTRARSVTGDTTLSGRVYDPRGVRLDADAVNKGALAPAAVVGPTIQFVREATPFFNPMVQALRKVGSSYMENPVRTNMKAWLSVGLPTLAIMGWNEMLGEQYNRHNFEERSSDAIAMNFPTIGIPGKPPEEGIPIPIAHELVPYSGIWSAALYSMMRGEEGDEVVSIMRHMAGTSLENIAMVGFPTVAGAGLALMGQEPPDTILNPFGWKDDIYHIREDNVGLLPQNIEATLRNLWGSAADTALVSAAAMWEGGPEAFFDELGHNVLKRTPLVKGPLGKVTPVTSFTPASLQRQSKFDAMYEFIDMYEEHVDKKHLLNQDNLAKKGGDPGSAAQAEHGMSPPDYEDTDAMTRFRAAPIATPVPSNPIVFMFGQLIKDTLKNNDLGMRGLAARNTLFTKQIQNLKTYTAGRKEGFREWQKSITGADQVYKDKIAAGQDPEMLEELGEAAKLERLFKQHKIDLSKRSDVTRFIGVMERERAIMQSEQLKLIEQVEDKMTEILQAQKMLRPGQRFDVEKHLGRLPPKDLLPKPSHSNQPLPAGPALAVPRQ